MMCFQSCQYSDCSLPSKFIARLYYTTPPHSTHTPNPQSSPYSHLNCRIRLMSLRKSQNSTISSYAIKRIRTSLAKVEESAINGIQDRQQREGMFMLAPVRPFQQYFMKFTPIFAGGPLSANKLHSSASSKVLLREGDFDPTEVVREKVLVPSGDLPQQQRHYLWRSTTEFPIVRVAAWNVRGSDGTQVQLQVLRESVPTSLEQMTEIPLFRVLYLLKETLIASERLFQRFGSFKMSARMVGINHAHKCRVWISEDLATNHFTPLGEAQQGFLRQLWKLFQQKTLKGKTVAAFYSQLEKCNSFAAALGFIDHYTRQNKIAIPSFFKSDRLPEGPTLTPSKFQPSLTMTRSPRFIASLRDTLTPAINRPPQHEQAIKEAKPPKDNKPSLLALKKSAETRADVYGSGTMTITDSKSREDLEGLQYLSAQEIPPPSKSPAEKMQKSELLQFKPKGQKPYKPVHRVTNRELFSCFTPQPQQQNSFHHWDTGHFFLSPAEHEQEEKGHQTERGLQNELQSLFQRNNWQQKIQGLFGNEGELKRSVHKGQPQWRHNQQDLPLLQHLGKAVLQSALHQQR